MNKLILLFVAATLLPVPLLAGGAVIIVDSVVPDSAAATAGIQPGDKIVRLDGREIGNQDDLHAVIAAHEPGDTVALSVLRGGEAVELQLTFGERPDGGVSVGLRMQIMMDPGDDVEPGAATAQCLTWIEETFRIEPLMRELGLDLSDDYEKMRGCVGHDTARMNPANAVKYCNNIFKVHCSGVDLIADIGEALEKRCEAQLGESLGLRPEQYKGWRTCGKHRIFDRYSSAGEFGGVDACKAAFLDECGTNIDAAIESGETSEEQRGFLSCCSAAALDAEGRSDSGVSCEMIDDGFSRGPCHDRSVCVNRHTTEWIHCSALD